jgi:hypothetical protein
MNLAEKIERAFAGRRMPLDLVEADNLIYPDSDVEDTLWFTGRDWHQITWQDWQEHSSAVYFFVPDAFAYYLPSLLLLSSQNPGDALMAADSLISELDRSPDPQWWTDGLVRRFLGLNSAELSVLKEWLLQVCEYISYKGLGFAASGPGDKFGRAFDTLDLLQKEVERRRLADDPGPSQII